MKLFAKLLLMLVGELAYCGGLFAQVTITPRVGEGWVFCSNFIPRLVFDVSGTSKKPTDLVLSIRKDTGESVQEFRQYYSDELPDSLVFGFELLPPGFYHAEIIVNKEIKSGFNFGCEPLKLISSDDSQCDLAAFWRTALDDLTAVSPDYKLTLLKEKCGKWRNVYLVSMKSIGNEIIRGYLITPKVQKCTFPAIISYMGYGAKPWLPDVDQPENTVQFILSVRGQALNEADNRYGDWILHNLGDRDNYFYRGAFMDLVRGIDFVCSRSEVDIDNIYAEGGSQGGAFALAAAALDSRLNSIAVSIPFLCDFPDYIRIANWPTAPLQEKRKSLNLSESDMLKMLSYFDLKNLAKWIKCPVIMGIGLQDDICPPHINMAAYNQISARKEYVIYPDRGHNIDYEPWYTKRSKFFEDNRR